MHPGTPPLETTVAFLFTDIEASTRLWEHYPEAMRDDLARHDALMHDTIQEYGGHVFKTIGDAFCAAFPTPEEAVGAATAIQQALRREVPQLRVRMAVHTGEVVARDGDYFGPALNRVARLLIAGHGGQILLSQATVEELEGVLPPGTRLESMGEHRLRDLATKERIHQLLFPGLPDRFPPLNTLDTAYRRGLMRASVIAAVVVALLAGLAVQVRRAERAAREGAWQRRVADERQRQIRYRTYSARLRQAQRAEEDHDSAQVLRLLDDVRPEAGQEDVRGFEWRYLWHRAQDMSRATLHGHIGGVLATAVSPDGKTIASCGEYDVRLWDMRSGRQTALFEDKRLVIFCDVAFSPDGKRVAASWASRVELRDRSSGRLLAKLKGEQGVVGPVEFSPDGRWLASGGQDGTVKLWDMASRRVLATFPGFDAFFARDPFPQFATSSIAFSPDSRTLAVCEADGRVGLWDLRSRSKVASFKAHDGPVWSVAFSPDGRLLASGGGDQTVRLWESEWGNGGAAPREKARLRGHTAPVIAVAFAPDSRLVASAGEDQSIRLWKTDTHRELTTLHGHLQAVWALAFTPDGKTLVSAGGGERTVRLWDVKAPLPNPVVRKESPASALAFSPDGKLLASAHRDGTVRLSEARAGRPLAVLKGHTGEVSSLSFSPDGRLLASGGKEGVVKLWDVASRQVIRSLPGFHGDGRGLAFMPDGRTLAMQSGEAVKLVDRTTGRTLASFSRIGLVGGIALSRDGRLLAAFTNFGVVTVWDTTTRRVATTVAGFGALAFSPDGRILAVDTFAPAPKLVDLATHQVVGSLSGHSLGGSLVFSPDGRTVATGGAHANDILLWNVITQDEVATLKGQGGVITALAFSRDGTTLASSSVDGTLSLWQATTFRRSDPPRVVVGADRNSLLLQWQPVPSAVGYHVYRQSTERPPGEWTRIARLMAGQTSFLDQNVGAVLGKAVTYAVAPVFREPAGEEEEGQRVVCKGVPVEAPPGFRGYRIQEELGSARFDPATGTIDLSGSGEDIWDRADRCYYLCRPVTGDFQVSVRVLTRPTYTDRWAKAGLMLRYTPEAGARNAFLFATAAMGLNYQWRPEANNESEIQEIDDPWRPGVSLWSEAQQPDEPSLLIPREAPLPPVLRMPLTLRLTRRGDVVSGEYSTDGRRFHPAGRPWFFTPPLPKTVNLGLAITAHKFNAMATTRFQDLVIREQSGRR